MTSWATAQCSQGHVWMVPPSGQLYGQIDERWKHCHECRISDTIEELKQKHDNRLNELEREITDLKRENDNLRADLEGLRQDTIG